MTTRSIQIMVFCLAVLAMPAGCRYAVPIECDGCFLPCGNGTVDPGEVCDDGNNESGDGCNATCTSIEICGNGIVDTDVGEQCDDENAMAGDGCSAMCVWEYCGNSEVDPGEVCDDGNNESGDGCSANCLSDETCGNGIVDGGAGEQCDDGNDDAGDGCSQSCAIEYCGNSVIDPGEACDDGNHVAGDGCPEDCWIDVIMMAIGGYHTCALLETGAVRCWGRGDEGQLGYGNQDHIGDDETPASAGDVPYL